MYFLVEFSDHAKTILLLYFKNSKFYFSNTVFDFKSVFLEISAARGICRSFSPVYSASFVTGASQIKNVPNGGSNRQFENINANMKTYRIVL